MREFELHEDPRRPVMGSARGIYWWGTALVVLR
jgi:hypothetical protein